MSDTTKTLHGPVIRWGAGITDRRYAVLTLPYHEFVQVAQIYEYDATKGKGEQRGPTKAHVHKLTAAMKGDCYTPTSLSVGLKPTHQKALKVEGDTFRLDILCKKNSRLPITDGGHRLGAIENLKAFWLNELAREMKGVEVGEDGKPTVVTPQMETLSQRVADVDALPITFLLHLDGDTMEDFLNLQAGKPADKSQMLSMLIEMEGEKDESLRLVLDVARILHNEEGPFKGIIQFDARSRETGALSLPLTTLCAQGSSDRSFSLVGLARVGFNYKLGAELLASCVVVADETLRKHAKDCITEGRYLRPIKDGGKKGGATLLVGIATMLAYRLAVLERAEPTKEDIGALAEAARDTWGKDGAFSEVKKFDTGTKRSHMANFAALFFGDLNVDKVEDIPWKLVDSVPASAFDIKGTISEEDIDRAIDEGMKEEGEVPAA